MVYILTLGVLPYIAYMDPMGHDDIIIKSKVLGVQVFFALVWLNGICEKLWSSNKENAQHHGSLMVPGSRKTCTIPQPALAKFVNICCRCSVFTSSMCIIDRQLLMQSRWAEGESAASNQQLTVSSKGSQINQTYSVDLQVTYSETFSLPMAGDHFGLFLWLPWALGHWWLSAPCAAKPRHRGGWEVFAESHGVPCERGAANSSPQFLLFFFSILSLCFSNWLTDVVRHQNSNSFASYLFL